MGENNKDFKKNGYAKKEYEEADIREKKIQVFSIINCYLMQTSFLDAFKTQWFPFIIMWEGHIKAINSGVGPGFESQL